MHEDCDDGDPLAASWVVDFNPGSSNSDLGTISPIDWGTPNTATTLEAWVKADSPSQSTYGTIAGRHQSGGIPGLSSVYLRLAPTNRLAFTIQVTSGALDQIFYDFTAELIDGDWHHLAGVWESGLHLELYVDGLLVGTSTSPLSGTMDEMSSFCVARNCSYASQEWSGAIGRVYASSVGRYSGSFVPTWDVPVDDGDYDFILGMNEGTGSVSVDLTGNGNDLVLSGQTWDWACEGR